MINKFVKYTYFSFYYVKYFLITVIQMQKNLLSRIYFLPFYIKLVEV